MQKKDYYEILGIAKNADKEEIKKAYHRLAHKHHPDKTQGDEQKFKEINEAYQVLINDKKRAEYDRYGRVFSENQGGGEAQDQGFDFDFGSFGNEGFKDFDFSDVFGNFFGGGFESGTKKRVKRGRDVHIDIEISFKEMVFGAERRVVLNKPSICRICGGEGAESGTEYKSCELCRGTGTIKENRRSFFGSVTSLRECGKCRGAGKIPQRLCKNCGGVGIIKKNEEITIKIPSGIDDGEMIKFTGKGEDVAKGIGGDLYVKIHINKHHFFAREGNNIFMTLDIPITDAILGEEKTINLFDEETIKLKIPRGTDSEDILRIKGKGILLEHNRGRGDLLIKIKARTPKKLSNRAKQLIEELKKEGV